ncbi:MAG TPA: type II secretion system F family protein [Bryobacteraceae bacterium]|jgi:general secretion pathway protein F
MTTYFFRAIAPDGKVRTGSLTAETDKLVARELRRQGLTPVYVGSNRNTGIGLSLKLPFAGGNRRKDVLFFTQELSTLLTSGVPVDRGLSITAELTERPVFKGIVTDVLRTLKGGKSLADSLSTHPEYFGDLYVNMVRAGEASGSLATVFERLSEFEKSRDELRNYVISSMIYPVLLAAVGLGSILVLMNFVVPRFASVFQDSHMKIPLPTQIMLDTSKIVQTWWWVVAAALVVLFGLFKSYTATQEGRLAWDRLRLRIPLLGDALLKAETSRMARAMSTLVANSVPLVQSLGISAGILNNKYVARALAAIAQGVKRGEGLAGPMRKAGVFPPLAAHLLTVGEETGKLDQMFARMADIYENETRSAIRRFTSLFEPIVILVMGLVVGALVLSMLLAITGINDVQM